MHALPKRKQLTTSPLIYQLTFASGFEGPKEQVIFTSSPTKYLGCRPMMSGPFGGSAVTRYTCCYCLSSTSFQHCHILT